MANLCDKDEFYKMMDVTDSEDEKETDDNISKCLISREVLNDSKVRLPCNHSFNYVPLYKEIYNQKKNASITEIVKLRYNQIKCPYCRTIHNYLIPYKKYENVEIVYGVNSPRKYVYFENVCSYTYKKGLKKGQGCAIRCCDKYCSAHSKCVNTDTVGKTNIKKNISQKNEIVSSKECNYIFKRGKVKGEKCGACVLIPDSLYCKKHNKYNV